jgi:ATP-dependent helicase/nuclease subunit A
MEFSVQSPSLELKRIIKAGAGAGKTTTLVSELYQYFVNFKAQNKKAPKIIVTTFTKKATQELKERLLKKAIEENNEDFFSYINNKNLIFISTIHGVLNLFLKQNAESFGFRKNIEILSESDEELLFEKNLRTLLVDNDELASLLQNYSVSELYQFCMDYQELIKVEPNFNFYTELEFREYIEKNLKDILQNLVFL